MGQPWRAPRVWLAALGAVLLFAAFAAAQFRFQSDGYEPTVKNVAYDGRFTFARLRYQTAPGGYWYQGLPSWSHGYPDSEDKLMRIMNELSELGPRLDAFNVFSLDDPELSRYSVAYLCEPGFWLPTEPESAALRTWIEKGGFLIIDDFYNDRQWAVFERAMKSVLPNGRIVPLDVSHPIFNSFFKIDSLDGMWHPDDEGARAKYLGIYEDNDPAKRLLVVINFNNDIGDYMEWSGQGVYAINFSNDAYKLATNYVVYGLTH